MAEAPHGHAGIRAQTMEGGNDRSPCGTIPAMQIKRWFLYTVFLALALATLAGVAAILGAIPGDLAWQGIMSMLAVSFGCAVAIAAMDVMEKQIWRPLMIAAIVADILALVGCLFMIWLVDLLFGYRGGRDEYGVIILKSTGLLAIGALIPVMAGQVAAIPLSDKLRHVRHLCIGLLAAVGVMLAAAILLEIEVEGYYQLLGILAILALFGIVALRLAQRVETIDRQTDVETTPMSLKITCPRCLLEQTINSGTARCQRCRLKFTVEIEEPRCPKCRYVLHMLTDPRCPECGEALAPEEIASG